MAAALAKRGLAAVSIDYRASGEATFPAAVEDTKAAVRWMRANAARYHLDPNAIGAIGGSAGAHLAAYLGLTRDARQFEGDGGNRGVSSAVSAVVGFATPTDC
jgi:acetyl esterase/lipase